MQKAEGNILGVGTRSLDKRGKHHMLEGKHRILLVALHPCACDPAGGIGIDPDLNGSAFPASDLRI